jgi:hypothetical protein
MDLRNFTRISTPECFICRWAGKHIILWPQVPTTEPEEDRWLQQKEPVWTAGTWKVFRKVEENIIDLDNQIMRSRHTSITACGPHWFALHSDWESTARQEVDTDNAYNNWMDLMER